MSTIALVDDDKNILTSLSMAFQAEGYHTQTYSDGRTALVGLRDTPPDIAILDIKMPHMDGLELLSQLRQHSDIPVIILTSKDDELDELLGLKMGADDFIRKPFSQRILIERVKGALRQACIRKSANSDDTQTPIIERGRLVMDSERHLCTWDGNSITLTVKEFRLLWALVQWPGTLKSRDSLMDAAYDNRVFVTDRTTDSHIKRLRKKFTAVDSGFDEIETLYGLGYRFKER